MELCQKQISPVRFIPKTGKLILAKSDIKQEKYQRFDIYINVFLYKSSFLLHVSAKAVLQFHTN